MENLVLVFQKRIYLGQPNCCFPPFVVFALPLPQGALRGVPEGYPFIRTILTASGCEMHQPPQSTDATYGEQKRLFSTVVPGDECRGKT